MGAQRPWEAASQAGLAPQKVRKLLCRALDELPSATWEHADLAIVVMRGGALLELELRGRVPMVDRLRARREGTSVSVDQTPCLPSAVRRLLLCDVLADTGATLLECARWARTAAPNAQIDLVCVYSTEAARRRLLDEHRLFSVAVFGRPDWKAEGPADIPYDFGDVAASCGLT